MAEAKTLNEYEQFGKQLHEFGVSSTDLEARINGLGEVSDDQIKSIVTGFIDALGESEWKAPEFYEIVHGFGRWMYNGNFKDMRERALKKILKSSNGQVMEWLSKDKKDKQAIKQISEMAIESDPEITYHWHPKEGREEALRKIVDKHYSNEKSEELVLNCLRELKDTDKLRAFANERVTKDHETAWNLLAEHGTIKDWRAAVNIWKEQDLLYAYQASEFIASERRAEESDIAQRDSLHARVIQEKPKAMFNLIRYGTGSRHQRHYRNDYRKAMSEDETKKAFVEIGKRLFELGELSDALECFNKSDYRGNEYENIGLQALKAQKNSGDDPKLEEAKRFAVPKFFEQGGDAEVTYRFANLAQMSDDFKRKLGRKLAKLPTKEYRNNAEHAYECLMRIKNKTESDNRKIAQMRERIIDESDRDWDYHSFERFDDKVGLQGFLEKKELGPRTAYTITRLIGSEPQIDRARRRLMEEEGLKRALFDFREVNDETGIKYVESRLGAGVDPELAKKLLPMDKIEKY